MLDTDCCSELAIWHFLCSGSGHGQLTSILWNELLYIAGNVLIEFKLTQVEWLDHSALVQQQQPGVAADLLEKTTENVEFESPLARQTHAQTKQAAFWAGQILVPDY